MKHLILLSVLFSFIGRALAADILPVADLHESPRAKVIEKLGEPSKAYPLKGNPDQMPGEYLEYDLKHTNGVTVRMKDGKLAQASVTCDPSTPETVLGYLGFKAAPQSFPGGTPIMKLYLIIAPDGSRWEAKVSLTRAGATTTDLINLKPL